MKHLYLILFVLLFIGCEKKSTIVQVQQPDYKEYVALISQVGTNNPSVTVISNTFGIPIGWGRNYEAGSYRVHADGAFIAGKTVAFISHNLGMDTEYGWDLNSYAPDELALYTWVANTLVDGQLQNTSVMIRVYN